MGAPFVGGQAFAAPHVIRVVRSQEGLVAPKLLNYGVTSGSLIPLLVIGFLGGATLAITLVSLQYHGVTVGPELFKKCFEIAFGPFATMVVTYAIMILIISPLTRYMFKIAVVSK